MNEGLTAIRHGSGDPKRARVLEGAFKVFLAYGYSRTTMDDIAKAGDMSRPSLYLLFRNKKDIYRAITGCVLAQCHARARTALEGEGSLLDRLDRLVEHALFDMMREIEESPHGPALLDMKNSLAGDIIGEWRDGLDAILEQAILDETRATGADLETRGFTVRSLARTFFDALEGMKPRFNDPRCHLREAKTAARMLMAAIRP